ncbi:MAG: sensor histidine kinase [Blautia sp.]|nr:sensor histidine kinase [Blautia sp.]
MNTLNQKLHAFWGNLKLQTKYNSVLLTAVAILVLMMGVFFSGRIYDMVVADTIRQEQDSSSKTAPLIEAKIQKLVDTEQLLHNHEFYTSLYTMNMSRTCDTLPSNHIACDFQSEVRETLKDSDFMSYRIYLDCPAEDCTFFQSEFTSDIFFPAERIKGTYWYGIFQGTNVNELFCPSFYLGKKESQMCGDIAYIRRSTVTYHDRQIPMYTAIYGSTDSIEAILKDNLSLPGSVSYILNDRDNLVASSDEKISGIYWLSFDTIQDSFMSSNSFIERTILDQKVYSGFYSINNAGWFMVTILPSAPLVRQSNQIMIRFIVIVLAILALSMLIASRMSRSITNRISSVITQMNHVRKGNLKPMEPSLEHDEVGDLINTYNYMAQKMTQLMEEQAAAAEDLRIAEFNSLQAQINPHFLYNTMDMINWLAQQGRTSEISDAVQNLSRFYKLTLSKKQTMSTIAQEMEHISIYVKLQNMRFHNNIDLIIDIPDEIQDFPIPKLTLQPVVENAILHGILEKDTKVGTIVLTGWQEEADILLLISDDGVGIPPEILPHILSGNGKSTSGGTNIAIYNTHRRLQLLYGPDYGLSYNSTVGEGTEVTIRIPTGSSL